MVVGETVEELEEVMLASVGEGVAAGADVSVGEVAALDEEVAPVGEGATVEDMFVGETVELEEMEISVVEEAEMVLFAAAGDSGVGVLETAIWRVEAVMVALKDGNRGLVDIVELEELDISPVAEAEMVLFAADEAGVGVLETAVWRVEAVTVALEDVNMGLDCVVEVELLANGVAVVDTLETEEGEAVVCRAGVLVVVFEAVKTGDDCVVEVVLSTDDEGVTPVCRAGELVVVFEVA